MSIRNYPDSPRVYIDMDGVLADFAKAATEHKMDPKHFKRFAGAYLDMELIPGAVDAVHKLQKAGYFVFALTKIPTENPYAATEKLLWVNRHFPCLGDHVIISPDKAAVGTSRDYLIDDHPEWANAHNFKGKVITFKNWDEVFLTNPQLLRGEPNV